ncbi:zinc finger protein ZAT11-like [Salvia miltiorrhiza]|uniref:zinc finger protein ZAT11-like n=1 Tax=Salvia miltiorrhiza TaxID=226208 RepID=UPI0025AC63F9|nr:zinc finger protein ZAT11-like [Salvia miltiorrhiza]
MELEIPEEEQGCQFSPKLPGWSKTGKRTRAHQRCPSDDELAAEDLPPKKRKLDSGNSERNGKDLCCMKQHRCSICRRCFSSYQALGGHKAHHNKEGILEALHQCTFCYKVFSKGQALGGHRRHCQQPPIPKMFSFDLNELPPECSLEINKS